MRDRGLKKHPPVVELLSSDEESISIPQEVANSHTKDSLQKLSSQTKSLSLQKKKPRQPLVRPEVQSKANANAIKYDDICNFNSIKQSSKLNEHYSSLRSFVEHKNKNVLFVFGPSGCGKTILIRSALEHSGIYFQFATEKIEESEDDDVTREDSMDMIYRLLSSRDRTSQKVYIFNQFPINTPESSSNYLKKYVTFKQNAYDLVERVCSLNKYIFILNSEIFSSYYILSQNSQSRAINRLPNVSVIKMEGYGVRDIKAIISHFLQCHPLYTTVMNTPKALEEIVTEANGDARKALQIIYHKKLQQIAKEIPRKKAEPAVQFYSEDGKIINKTNKLGNLGCFDQPKVSQNREEFKVSIFHTLGKFLYGKRLNIFYNPDDKKNKKDNAISRIYTEKQIETYNPKFYFKPVELFDKSHMALNVFTELLEQNFLSRYGSVADVARMYSVFRHLDSYLDNTLNIYEIKDHMEANIKELVTWGIIINNRNSIKQNTFCKIQRSKNNVFRKIVLRKYELLKQFFCRRKDQASTGRYNVKDIIQYAYFLKNDKIKHASSIFQQKLIQIVFDNSKRSNSITSGSIESETSVIQEEEEMANENCSRLDQLADSLKEEQCRKQKMIEMMFEDSDESDIDSD